MIDFTYPTEKQIEEASFQRIFWWYRNLPTPGFNASKANFSRAVISKSVIEERAILAIIIRRYNELNRCGSN